MEVTNVQLYLSIGIPMLFNAALIGLLLAYMNARFDSAAESVNRRFDSVDQRFEGIHQRLEIAAENVNRRFDAVDRRFDDMRDLWRAELRRVEEVLDARLKHLEER